MKLMLEVSEELNPLHKNMENKWREVLNLEDLYSKKNLLDFEGINNVEDMDEREKIVISKFKKELTTLEENLTIKFKIDF